jgi:aryl-alcohol dehydrogenase-like predicted oxidoreductase
MTSSLPSRLLGRTGLHLPVLGLGTSALGAEFGPFDLQEAFSSVRVALDHGVNFIDTSPYYGRGMSEVLLGMALEGVPRENYTLCTKLGRYDVGSFDFSAKRVAESIDVSLHRLRTDHLDIVLCHDIEFVPLRQIIDETIPALRTMQKDGKVRFIGFSGYPMRIFRGILEETSVDCVLGYNQFTLQNTRFADEVIPYLVDRGVGVINAGPFAARLLTELPLPVWSQAPPEVRKAAKTAAAHCAGKGVDIAKLALQFSLTHPDITTTIAGSASPADIRKWASWIREPIDRELLAEVRAIFEPVKNIGHVESNPVPPDHQENRR